jgi:FKBP-type peptidyl-prolyl cis-trans isomerase 2
MTSNIGKTAVVHYRGTLDDGSEFDSSIGNDPLSFEVGGGDIIPGFDSAVAEMKPGEKRTVVIEPGDAYGERSDEAVQKAPIEMFAEHTPVEGEMVALAGPDGRQQAAGVKSVPQDRGELDFNHPLAGQRLTFEIELVELAAIEEIELIETRDGVMIEEVDVVETADGVQVVETVVEVEE